MPEYREHKDRTKRIESAIIAINALLPLELYPAHKRELLGICIWKITEADGKMKVRYWSEGSIVNEKARLQHEHVHERKELISRLLNGEITANMSEAQRYYFFSQALMNLGIRPVLGNDLWHEVRNPYTDIYGAEEVLASTKHKLEKQFSVDFPNIST